MIEDPPPRLTVRQVFEQHQGRLIDRWSHYFPIYERHLAKFVGRPIRMLEIGVGHGGSLQMWKRWFGPKAKIIGLDIDPQCKGYEEDQIEVRIGDQAKPPVRVDDDFDIIIDDGSHQHSDQLASFKALWPKIRSGGVYIIEDCHNGYPGITQGADRLVYLYPWIQVIESAKRMIIGTPSRELNEAEREAYGR